MRFEIGRDQFIAIGRASDALANRLSGGVDARVLMEPQSLHHIKFYTQGELADISVHMPVGFLRTPLMDYTKDVVFGSSYLNMRGEGDLLIDHTIGDISVEVMDQKSGESLDMLVCDNGVMPPGPESSEGAELLVRIPLIDLCTILERALWVVEGARQDRFKCVWVRFEEEEILVLSINGQMAVCAGSEAEVTCAYTEDVCFDLSCMKAIHFLAGMWSKRARVAEEVFCNIYRLEDEEFLFELAGSCIEATVRSSNKSNTYPPIFLGSWHKHDYRSGVSFCVDSEELDRSLAGTEMDMLTKDEDSITITLQNRRLLFRVEGSNKESVPPLPVDVFAWNNLPARRAVMHMCPPLLRSVLKRETGELQIEFPLNEDEQPFPYYVTLKKNKNIRYTLMPATGGCHV